MNKPSEPAIQDLSGRDLLPDGIKMTDLTDYWDMINSEYATIRKRMRLLDAVDSGKLWEAIAAQHPKYQILPETNHTNFIKENLLASIYTVGKYAELLPKAQEQVQYCNDFNNVLDKIWSTLDVPSFQRKAGERAALLNLGVTQVGWDNIVGGTENFLYKGDVKLKNIDPLKYARDPYSDSLENAKFVVTWDDYHLTTLQSVSIYKERLDLLIKCFGKDFGGDETTLVYEALTSRATTNKANNKYHRVQTFWVRYNKAEKDKDAKLAIAEIHVLDNKYILHVNEEISCSTFPFAELYCNEPGTDIIGCSEPAKVLKNSIAYNMLASIGATHAYKAQRPPRFLNMQSGINVRQFAKHGADADATFLVNGDASQAVHYGKFPDLPLNIDSLSSKLAYDIKDTSGVTDVYSGNNTGSIQTTGGTDTMINRVTGRDEVKIQLYESYTKRLTSLMVQYYIKFGDKRVYAIKDKTSNTVRNVSIDFAAMPNGLGFDYDLTIQSSLPKNKARLAQAANILLEKQAQYRPNPEIITMEEWLMMQDIPFKDLIMERIRLQRNTNMTEQVTTILFQFAGLIESGMDPEEALDMVTQNIQDLQTPNADLQGQTEQPMLGNTGNAGSFQNAQAGDSTVQNVYNVQ